MSCTSIQLNIVLVCARKKSVICQILSSCFEVILTHCWWNKSAKMVPKQKKINIFQGSVATVCRWSGHVSNYCAANYFNILSAKYCGNLLTFVETTVRYKRWVFFWNTVYIFVENAASSLHQAAAFQFDTWQEEKVWYGDRVTESLQVWYATRWKTVSFYEKDTWAFPLQNQACWFVVTYVLNVWWTPLHGVSCA